MGGRWQHRARRAEQQRVREALLPSVQWGFTPCYRCGHALEDGDLVELDHADDGTFGGFSHGRSPCRVCGQKCNAAHGGMKAAVNAGRRLRSRRCVICGKPFEASAGSDGSVAATCGNRECMTVLRARRKAGEPDGKPPPASGRVW